MNHQERPLLSVGLIVKNEERCLERCLQSLQYLKKAMPCQIVVADTGSTDGTWEIAAQYADELFHFEWINDFAAARNAVMDRCTGEWFLSIDADEWFHTEGDAKELIAFLTGPERNLYIGATLVIENCLSTTDTGSFNRFFAGRLAAMGRGIRFKGRIHEILTLEGGLIHAKALEKTVLRHDGYVLDQERASAKHDRNMEMLQNAIKEEGDSLLRLQQCIESSYPDERMEYVERALKLLRKKQPGSETVGPSVYMNIIHAYSEKNDLEEMKKLLAEGEAAYPDSIFINIDSQGFVLAQSYAKQDYDTAYRCGKRMTEWLERLEHDYSLQTQLLYGTLRFNSPTLNSAILCMFSECCCRMEDWETAGAQIAKLDLEYLSVQNWVALLQCICTYGGDLPNLQEEFQRLCDAAMKGAETSGIWKEKKAKLRAIIDFQFSTAAQGKIVGFHQMVAGLEQNDWGRSARILLTDDSEKMTEEMAAIEDWNDVLYMTYAQLMRFKIRMPIGFYRHGAGWLADVASVIPRYDSEFIRTLLQFYQWHQKHLELEEIAYLWDLTVATLRLINWKNFEENQGLSVYHMFTELSLRYLPALYQPQILTERNLPLLQGIYRFAWYCMEAEQCKNNRRAYIALLRKGLEAAPAMGGLVEFLADQVVKSMQDTTPELLELAEQVRGILARYDPNDPAVTALKASPAYQKVAHLIERRGQLVSTNILQ